VERRVGPGVLVGLHRGLAVGREAALAEHGLGLVVGLGVERRLRDDLVAGDDRGRVARAGVSDERRRLVARAGQVLVQDRVLGELLRDRDRRDREGRDASDQRGAAHAVF
jgi:hypothetical protein